VNQYQKGKTNLDFTEATDSEWQWNQLGHMQVCTLLQTDKHAITPPLSFYRQDVPSVRRRCWLGGSPGQRAVKRVCVCDALPATQPTASKH